MNPSKPILPCLLLALVLPARCAGQVEKVALRTTGISCGLCAGLSEIYFHRLQGVDKVKISLSQEAIMLTYRPGARFDPHAIRKILEPLKVGVVQFQVGVRGQVHENGGKRILETGGDKFVLLDAIDSPDVPAGLPLRIEGILFDRESPMEIKILKFEPLKTTPAPR
jgi:hypothetical protein